MCHSSLRAAVQPRPSPRCCEEFDDSVFQSHFALLRMEIRQLVVDCIEEASRPLREEVAALKLLLARVGDSLQPTEECASGGVGLTPAQVLFPLDSTEQKSSVVEEALHFGCFSPHGSPCPSPLLVVTTASEGEDIGGILAPALQVTLELQESSLDSSLASLKALAVASLPSVDSGGVLDTTSEALFAKELCRLLACLEASNPGCGKDIACVLTGTASDDVIRKVENSLSTFSLRDKRRKKGLAKKTSADAWS